MKEIRDYVEDIERIVWSFNSYHDKGEFETDLRRDPGSVAEELKYYAEVIQNSKREEIIRDATDKIDLLVRPRDRGRSEFYSEPGKYVYQIIEDSEAIINLAKTEGDGDLARIEEAWCGKFLLFNGDEEGVQIINARKIYYKGGDIVFDGLMIELCNENNRPGEGVLIYEVEGFDFRELYYIDYISSEYVCDEEKEERDELYPSKLQAILSSAPIDTELESRVVSREQVYKDIKEVIDYALDDKLYW